MTLFSSVSLLQIYQMGLFPRTCDGVGLEDDCGAECAHGSAPMVVGGGTLLVPMWLRGLVQLLMVIKVRIISNSGSVAMVAKILSLIMTTILKYWPRTRNT